MFQGFNESTIMYYKSIRRENCKKVHQDHEHLYLEGAKILLDGYKYGLNIYNQDAGGMNKIREYILDNKHYAKM